MEVRKSKIEVGGRRLEVRKKQSLSGSKNKRLLMVVGAWLLVLSLLAQPILAVNVNVQIEGPNSNVFDGSVESKDTTITASNGSKVDVSANKAAAALEAAAKKSGFSTSYDNGVWGLFLTTIAGIKNASDWSKTWSYRVNCRNANLGVQNQTINAGDKLHFIYSGWPSPDPLKLELSKNLLSVGESIQVITSVYDFNTKKYNPVSAAVKIGNNTFYTDNNGNLSTTINTRGTHQVEASIGKCKSLGAQILVGESLSTAQTSSSLTKAIRYLRLRQSRRDGKIENATVSAWSAIAFAAAGINPKTVKRAKGVPRNKRRSLVDYLRRYSQTSLNRNWLRKNRKATKPLATDYARQIMAVYASGQNPRNHGGVNLIRELARFYKNGQFGSTGLVNDDIFTIIAYRAGRVSPTDHKFNRAINFVLKNQHADGGFSYNTSSTGASDVDTTAAAIQALVLARKAGVKNLDAAIQKAYDNLVSKQEADGGFAFSAQFSTSNSQTNAWAIQAITSVKGSAAVNALVSSTGATPLYFQSTLQGRNGGFKYDSNSGSRAWSTASTIPALLNKPWLVKWRTAISINASKKNVKKGRRVRIFGSFSESKTGVLLIRYKRGRARWKTAKRVRVKGRTYSTVIRINHAQRYVIAARLGSSTSRSMVIYGRR